jgi:hypothetical protein
MESLSGTWTLLAMLHTMRYDMNGRFQLQGDKNWILPLMQTGSSGTFIGWKSGQTTFVLLWDRMQGAWQWTPRLKGNNGS